jgi:hypothetical protein
VPTTQYAGSPWQTSWSTSGAVIDTAIAALSAGDKVVVGALVESQSAIATPSNVAASPATITWSLKGTVNVASRCWAGIWEGVVTAGGNATIRLPIPATGLHGAAIWAFPASGHAGLGAAPAGTNGTGAGPSATATWTKDSTVCCVDADFAAGATGTLGTTRTYRAGNGSVTERAALQVDTNYTIYVFEYSSSVGGSQAVGMNLPTQTYSLVALEVLAPPSGVPASVDPQVQWTEDFGPSDDFGPNPFIEDEVPLSPVAAGPVTQTLVLLATVGSSASMVKQAGKVVAAAPGSVAVMVKQAGKVVLAAPGSAAVMVKQAGKVLAAASPGSAVLVRQPGKVLAAAAGSSASLVRTVGKVLAASAGSAATVIRQPWKVLAASAGATATLGTIKAKVLALSAVAGSVAVVSTVRTRVLTLAASTVASVVLARQVSKTVLAVEVTSATMTAIPPAGPTAGKGQLPTLGAG